MTADAQDLLFHEDHCVVQTLSHRQRLISNGLKRRGTRWNIHDSLEPS
jgi:hypothetical protein